MSKALHPYILRLEYEIYRHVIYVFFGHNDKEFDKEARKIFNTAGIEAFKEKTNIFQLNSDGKVSTQSTFTIIRFKQFPNPLTINSFECIQHEAFHAGVCVLRSVGCKMNRGSEEAYAYLIGNIHKKILTEVFKKLKFLKK